MKRYVGRDDLQAATNTNSPVTIQTAFMVVFILKIKPHVPRVRLLLRKYNSWGLVIMKVKKKLATSSYLYPLLFGHSYCNTNRSSWKSCIWFRQNPKTTTSLVHQVFMYVYVYIILTKRWNLTRAPRFLGHSRQPRRYHLALLHAESELICKGLLVAVRRPGVAGETCKIAFLANDSDE